jgi:membrane protease YdiL (CAAX protease family)
MKLPRSAYVWLVVLVVSMLAGRLLDIAEQQRERSVAVAEYVPNATEFTSYITAESNVRIAFGIEYMTNRTGIGGTSRTNSLVSQRDKSLNDALTAYRKLTKQATSPNIARRILVLENALRKPFDERLLTDDLAADLKVRKKSDAEIKEELAFWRALYGTKDEPPKGLSAASEQRIEQMQLGFLQDKLRSDLYQRLGDKTRAEAAQKRLDAKAQTFVARQLSTNLTLLLSFVLGFIFLLVYLFAAFSKQWTAVKRESTYPLTIPYGIFVDTFIAYLALIFASRVVLSLLFAQIVTEPTRELALGLALIGQMLPAIIATIYLLNALRKHATVPENSNGHAFHPFAEIGLTANNLIGNVFYGIAGYCAALPLVLGLGALSRLLFKDNPNTAPNIALPLISSEQTISGQIVLFILVAMNAPIFEELFFRGALFSGLRQRFGWVVGVFVSSVLFAVVHPMQDWLPIFGLGVAFAIMREMRQSLVPSMVAHFLQNALTFFTLSSLFRN